MSRQFAEEIEAGVRTRRSGFGGKSGTDKELDGMVASGVIRIGVFPSFQYTKESTTGRSRGLAIGIAQAMASRCGAADVVTVEHSTPSEVIASIRAGECDFGFMQIDPARATKVHFSPPFVRSDFTYLVPAGSPLSSVAEIDQPELCVAVVRDHATTAAWLQIARQAAPVFVDSYELALEAVRIGTANAFASIREMLLKYSPQLPGSRVLADSYQTSLAGVAVANDKPARLALVSATLNDMKRSGELHQIIRLAGLRGIEVVPTIY